MQDALLSQTNATFCTEESDKSSTYQKNLDGMKSHK